MKTIVYFLLSFGGLLWGAITDYKRREIENGVHVLLILGGLFAGLTAVDYAIGFLIPPIVWVINEKIKGSKGGAGDIKLLAALGFNVGLWMMAVIMLVTQILVLPIAKRQERFPVCTYVCGGYVITWFLVFLLRETLKFVR